MAATSAPKEVVQLVERFERNRDAYLSGGINETQLRREFLDPFFKALGWDIDNEQGYAEAYKDVIHEDAIKVGGHQSAGLLLPHRRHAQVLSRSQETRGGHQARCQSGLPTPPLRLDRQAPALDPHRLRGVRRL